MNKFNSSIKGKFFNVTNSIRKKQLRKGSSPLRLVNLLAVLVLGMSSFSAHAESVFYSNIFPAVFTTAPVYSVVGLSEWSDDMPFSGSHLVSSFTFGYKTPGPVQATLRFYGVEPTTGRPGALIAEIIRDLPGGANSPVIQLTQSEQFIFTAEPGLNLTENTGGWFSVSFIALDSTTYPASILIRHARGDSARGMYNITGDKFVATFDPGGLLPGSMYLQAKTSNRSGSTDNTVGSDVAVSELKEIQLMPSTVNAGAVANGTVLLDGPAPKEGVTIKLSSSRKKYAKVSVDEVFISEGLDRASFYVTTRSRVRRSKKVIISAEYNNIEIGTTLKIVR